MKSALVLLLLTIFMALSCKTRAIPEKSGFIRVGSLQVYFEDKGKGAPVMLVHAGLQQSDMWKEQVIALEQQYRVITIDLPGHGKTVGTDTTLLIASLIKTVLDSLDIEKSSFMGLSLGTVCIQDFAVAYPERVSKLILVSPGIHGYEDHYPVDSLTISWYPKMQTALEKGDTIEAARVFTRTWAEGPYRISDSLQKPVSQVVYKTTLDNMRLHKVSGWPVLQTHPKAFEQLSRIRTPLLIVHGDKDLPYVAEASRYFEKTIPGSRRVLLKDVAHMLNLEEPAAFNELVLQFLN